MRTRTSKALLIPAADGGNATLEIMVLWGEHSVLHVSHFTPPRAFYLGEDADFVIGEELLGSSRLPLVLEEQGELSVVVPRGARAEIERKDSAERGPVEAQEPLPDHPGASSFPLRSDGRVWIFAGELTFSVRFVAAAEQLLAAGASEPALKRSRWTVASAAAHVAVLGLWNLLPPSSSVLSMDRLDTDSRLVKYAIEAHETPVEPTPTWLGGAGEAGGSTKAAGDEGEAGAPNKPKLRRKSASAGTNATPTPTPEEARAGARNAGIIGIVRASTGSSSTQFTAQLADEGWIDGIGQVIGESGGRNGLGMIGTGRGGGGPAGGTIGIGGLGTHGRLGDGDGDGGYGMQAAGGYHERTARVPRIRTGTPELHGALSKEIIRRVINRHINEIRFCYEQQLISQPDLQGRVSVKFVISPSGAVSTAVVEQSDLGSAKVDSCIASAVRRMDFPAPEGGGLVLVSYPFLLSQTGN